MIRRRTDDRSFRANADDVFADEKQHIGVSKPSHGLALSGGGIRSAAFSLGVLQALARGKLLNLFDYMSTVSGGGYIGCSLTWWLSRELPKDGRREAQYDTFPFSMDTDYGKSIVDFLRLHGNYLLPGAGLNLTSIFAVVLRNAIVAFLVYFVSFSVVLLAMEVLLDFVLYESSRLTDIILTWISNRSTLSESRSYLVFIVLYVFALILAILKSTLTSRFWQIYRLVLFVFAIALIATQPLFNNILETLYEKSELSLLKSIIFVDIFCWMSFVAGSLFYSVLTIYYQWRRRTNVDDSESEPLFAWNYRRYDERTFAQKLFGKVLTLSVALVVVSVLAFLQQGFMTDGKTWFYVLIIVIPVIGLAITFSRIGTRYFTLKNQRIVPVGAWLFISGCILWSFKLVSVAEVYLRRGGQGPWIIGAAVLLWIIIGFLVNVNYFGIHRMYRDRLMEIFLPDREAVEKEVRQFANEADRTTLASICGSPCKRPYHLINTNVVLVDSPTTKYRSRGGDNFILSPLYCGSGATGWRRSANYLTDVDPGVTLATAMAISGAAANPNTGRYGLTRDRSNSLLMSVLGFRLGYWAPNPNPDISSNRPPNFFFPGIASVVLGSLKEDRKVLDLTDGGHFENLGLYELVRRKLTFIVVCDSSADLNFRFRELAVAINRVKVDFGASIRFANAADTPKNVDTGEGITSHLSAELKARGFASAEICYEDKTKGRLIYIKPILMDNLAIELYSYKARHPDFPYETTYDQFFDEDQFEAYRELGMHLGNMFVDDWENNQDENPDTEML